MNSHASEKVITVWHSFVADKACYYTLGSVVTSSRSLNKHRYQFFFLQDSCKIPQSHYNNKALCSSNTGKTGSFSPMPNTTCSHRVGFLLACGYLCQKKLRLYRNTSDVRCFRLSNVSHYSNTRKIT